MEAFKIRNKYIVQTVAEAGLHKLIMCLGSELRRQNVPAKISENMALQNASEQSQLNYIQ